MSGRAAGRVSALAAKPEVQPYLDAFVLPEGEPFWLWREREESLARFAEEGFPSRKNESWRSIDLEPLAKNPLFPLAEAPQALAAAGAFQGALLARLEEARVEKKGLLFVLRDGRFDPALSSQGELPEGVRLGSISAAARSETLLRPRLKAPSGPFAALNAAFFRDGFFLEIAPGTILDQPIEIVHLVAAAASLSLHTRSLVLLGEESRATLCESFIGEGRYWRNDRVDIALAPSAELSRFLILEEGENAIHFDETEAVLGEAARFSSCAILLRGRTLRQETNVISEGRGARSVLNAAALLSGRQEANIVSAVEHHAAEGETRELVKIAASGRAHGAFQGRITVHPGAQKVDAHQLSQNLLLSPRAAVDAKPELEIFADDVKCSHGAAVGDLDEAQIFYCRSRGLPQREARGLLIEAFLRDVLAEATTPLARHLSSRLSRRLATLEEEP